MLTFFWECLFYFGYWFFKPQIFFESLLLDIVFVFKISSFVFLYVFTCGITCFIWIFYGFRKNLFSCRYFQKHVLFPFVISPWFYKIYLVLQEVWIFTYLYYYEYSDFKSFELFRPFFAEFPQYVYITIWGMFMNYLEFMFLCWIAQIDHKFVMAKH